MKIIIVGNGKVGYAIASQLAGEHHDIVMVDDNAVALQRAENALDVMCIEENPTENISDRKGMDKI